MFLLRSFPETMPLTKKYVVDSPKVKYDEDFIYSEYTYTNSIATMQNGVVTVRPKSTEFVFRTERKVPKLGAMIVGLCGNNGSTLMGGIIANREGISWRTKEGVNAPDYFGSLTQVI